MVKCIKGVCKKSKNLKNRMGSSQIMMENRVKREYGSIGNIKKIFPRILYYQIEPQPPKSHILAAYS